MSDWPAGSFSVLPSGLINSGSLATDLGMGIRYWSTSTNATWSGGALWPAANRAYYLSFRVEVPVTAYRMAFEVTAQAGNYDIGIYDILGNRLVSKGSTAVPAAGLASVDITDTVLTPGHYFMALCLSDATTAAVSRITVPDIQTLRVCGVQTQDVGAVTLPDPATFANPAAAYVPLIAVVLQTVI